MLRRCFLCLVLAFYTISNSVTNAMLIPQQEPPNKRIVTTTRAKSKLSGKELQDFLSRPIHWPMIVASSDSVENDNPTAPLRRGGSVKEYFGLGILSVTWICRTSKPGVLVMESPDGVPRIANECSMAFNIQEDGQVELTMGYNPVSPLAVLATPILIVDNWIALNVLLPAAVDPNPLDSFRKLMGGLYGIAGVAHAADLLVGGSVLFTSNGIPAYSELPVAGQAYAALWCVVGPLAYWASRQSSASVADAGLISYGLVEVLGGFLTGNVETFGNAAVVQAVVLAAWLYSNQKGKQQ